MNRETENQVYEKAKQMIIAGESWDKIMEETRLRQRQMDLSSTILECKCSYSKRK
ncbi:hypothetical protein [Clostridium perfringens]|uniref:hypothetical protein n=1 Tax=Clostridium perfringens TaxID=1502 RepID=UPI002ACC38BC|nr:hypothetical protein [Clostridium perfringens]